MAFNLMVVTETPIEWPKVQNQYQSTDQLFEIFPISDAEPGDAIGVSIPMNQFNQQSWASASGFLRAIADDYQFTLYDMYLGQSVDLATYAPDGMDAG